MTSVKRSDHYTLIANFAISWKKKPIPRQEVFKLRDAGGLQKFAKLTAKASSLKKCFTQDMSLVDAYDKWYKEFDKLIHRCFSKIRISETPPKNTIDYQVNKLLNDVKHL